ncbi:MAG: hypothetical protein FJZ43_04735 [Candidatus Staskawiczbacteria bacterium]|nr:hypothetical protein [Candidatus Staskawiczbacteria bacterium]
MENNPEKIKLAKEAGQIFSDQFGPDDIYKSILFEVFLEELKLTKEENGNTGTNQGLDLSDET